MISLFQNDEMTSHVVCIAASILIKLQISASHCNYLNKTEAGIAAILQTANTEFNVR